MGLSVSQSDASLWLPSQLHQSQHLWYQVAILWLTDVPAGK